MVSPELPVSSSASYTDRKGGLVAFGIMTMCLGGIFALLVPLIIFSMSIAPKGLPGQDLKAIIPAVVFYGLMAVVLIWLGIGSIKARRWARALLLILSWSALLIGVFSLAFMFVWMPRIVEVANQGAPAGQSAPMGFIMGMTMFFMFVIMVLIPGVWVLFYRSRNVKVTCEVEDPVERWTDRCPLPVIGLSLWIASAIPSLVFMALGYKAVVPFFGNFLVGPGGMAIYLVLAALWAYAARALYQLRWSGWWIVAVSVVLFGVSAFLTYSRHDIMELYELMGYPAEQMAELKKFNFLSGQTMAWMMSGFVVPLLGYLIFVRRYFPSASRANLE